jgi:hypothetical protein
MPGQTTFDRIMFVAVAGLIAAFALGASGPLVSPAAADDATGNRGDDSFELVAKGEDDDDDDATGTDDGPGAADSASNSKTGTTRGTGESNSKSNTSYVTKPFKLDELLARVRVQLRDDRSTEPTVLETGSVTLDIRTRTAMVEAAAVDLTAREFTMLETFMGHAGQVLSREQLLAHAWGYDYNPGSNVVEVYVRYLRRKLGEDAIETVRGMGYRMPL